MIDNNTVDKARNVDILAFFGRWYGFTFAENGGNYRCNQHKSLAVKSDRLSWYWHSKGMGGHGALDYLVKVEGLPFRQAVEVVTAESLCGRESLGIAVKQPSPSPMLR